MHPIDRREALKRLSLVLGGTLSASTISAVLGGCGVDGDATAYRFKTLSKGQDELVASMAEAIIPTTDTPGARAAGVDRFIDLMLSSWMYPNEKRRFLDGLAEFRAAFQSEYGKAFSDAEVDEQLAFMTPLDEAAVEARRADAQPLPFFATLKELVVTGYYTSEIGASEELRFQMIFPKYDGNVDFKEGDRAWS